MFNKIKILPDIYELILLFVILLLEMTDEKKEKDRMFKYHRVFEQCELY